MLIFDLLDQSKLIGWKMLIAYDVVEIGRKGYFKKWFEN